MFDINRLDVANNNQLVEIFLCLLRGAMQDISFDELNSENIFGDVDWEAIFELAKSQNVLPLVFEKVKDYKRIKEHESFSYYLNNTIACVAGQSLRTEHFLDLYSSFCKNNIYPIVVKGLVCRLLYGEHGDYRPSSDEDILIQVQDYEKVKSILNKLGYFSVSDVDSSHVKDVKEISFTGNNGLNIEVHFCLIGYENKWWSKMNECFNGVFGDFLELDIDGKMIHTLTHTDHLLYLIFHAIRHFSRGGIGIRHVMDILQYIKNYGLECDWDYIELRLKEFQVEEFFIDLLWIGNEYLGFSFPVTYQKNAGRELLNDILGNGIFGNTTQAQKTASQILSIAVSYKRGNGIVDTIKTVKNTIFLNFEDMKYFYPGLKEKPWLLPICWVLRWKRIIKKHREKNVVDDSQQISKNRIKLLKKYGIL